MFTLEDFRNAIAHNGVVLDVRFQSGSINTGIAQLLKQETGVGKIDFTDIIDYVILLVYLMRRMGFTKNRVQASRSRIRGNPRKVPKRAAHQYLFQAHQDEHEGKLTALRQP